MPAAQVQPHPERCAPAILVVEDEVLIRAAVSEFLRGCGYSVLEAGHAREAMAILGSGAAVDLVFTDICMPGEMDGIALGRWIDSTRPGLPVFLTSGDPHCRKAAEDFAIGGTFFAKPYDLDELSRRIASALSAPQLRAL